MSHAADAAHRTSTVPQSIDAIAQARLAENCAEVQQLTEENARLHQENEDAKASAAVQAKQIARLRMELRVERKMNHADRLARLNQLLWRVATRCVLLAGHRDRASGRVETLLREKAEAHLVSQHVASMAKRLELAASHVDTQANLIQALEEERDRAQEELASQLHRQQLGTGRRGSITGSLKGGETGHDDILESDERRATLSPTAAPPTSHKEMGGGVLQSSAELGNSRSPLQQRAMTSGTGPRVTRHTQKAVARQPGAELKITAAVTHGSPSGSGSGKPAEAEPPSPRSRSALKTSKVPAPEPEIFYATPLAKPEEARETMRRTTVLRDEVRETSTRIEATVASAECAASPVAWGEAAATEDMWQAIEEHGQNCTRNRAPPPYEPDPVSPTAAAPPSNEPDPILPTSALIVGAVSAVAMALQWLRTVSLLTLATLCVLWLCWCQVLWALWLAWLEHSATRNQSNSSRDTTSDNKTSGDGSDDGDGQSNSGTNMTTGTPSFTAERARALTVGATTLTAGSYCGWCYVAHLFLQLGETRAS